MNMPVVSDRFDMGDVRKIRDYNSARHIKMTRKEIVDDIRRGADGLIEALLKRKTRKRIAIISGDQKTVYGPPAQ